MNSLKSIVKKLKGDDCVDVSELPLDFDAKTYINLNPDVAESGQNPYSHYIMWGRHEKRPYKNEPTTANLVANSALPEDFNAEEYRELNPDLSHYKGSLAEHFLRNGISEFRQYRRTPPYIFHKDIPKDFDPNIYLTLNPDINFAPLNPYEHYLAHGRSEGRKYKFPSLMASYGRDSDARKPTILLVGHEASRTGAPVLTWNICHHLSASHNVVVVLLGGGPLVANFQFDAHATYILPDEARYNTAVATYAIEKILQEHKIGYAIVNSIVSEIFCEPLTTAKIPNTLLIHEFAAYTFPEDKFLHARTWASAVVFSTEIIKKDAQFHFPEIFDDTPVIPQGQCLIPPNIFQTKQTKSSAESIINPSPAPINTGKKLVIGLGSVYRRKGVDLFVEVATRMEELAGENEFEFLWVGNGFYPPHDPEYSAFLKDQISRSGLEGRIRIVEETDDLITLYKNSSLLVLSSRLDPLPNVAIDAICLGLPLVCFDKASGISDILIAHGLRSQCVANYIDTADMARKAVSLLDSEVEPVVRKALLDIGSDTFSMPRYCLSLIKLQETATLNCKSASSTVNALLEGEYFDAAYYASPTQRLLRKTKIELCWDYVLRTVLNKAYRKPRPGFNPLAYRERLALPLNVDPLLHYTNQADRQDIRLITPVSSEPSDRLTQQSRTALHLHAFYPDLLPDILQRLRANQCAVDVFVTVDSEVKRAEVQRILHSFDMQQTRVECVPNVGRDIYPFLDLCSSIIDQYDVIGHLHTKKSPHVTDGSDLVTRWRELLLGNLLGSDREPRMLDRIIGHMDKHPEVQIVFPDDPHVLGWGKNEAMARQLVSEDDFSGLPRQFDFPVGTMFWSRAAYLRSFLEMNLPKRFTPAEPLPIDGTVLHAWERLLGAKAATGQPPRYALTFVPGLTR